MRIILFTGKGGVGKTTMAAATALKAAKEGHKTLVMSTDPAHSLADALDVELGPEPVEVVPNLYAQEFDVYYSMKKYWGNMRQLMLTLFRFKGVKNVIAEELAVLPGMEEASAFLWIEKFYSEGNYDLLIIDSAPTGETLTLLSLPQVMQSWLTRAFPGQRFAVKTMGAVMRKVADIPIDKGYEELEHLFEKMDRIQQIFTRQEICSIRIVANPERMVVQEAKRSYTYLQLYGYHVDAVIVNRILPKELKDSVLGKYIQSQTYYLEEIEESFAPVPIFKVGHLGEEVFGLDRLQQISEAIYGTTDPEKVLHQATPFEVKELKNGYQLSIRLPFIEEDDFELHKYGDELVIDLNNRRRNVFLPRFSNMLQLESYSFEHPWLRVILRKS